MSLNYKEKKKESIATHKAISKRTFPYPFTHAPIQKETYEHIQKYHMLTHMLTLALGFVICIIKQELVKTKKSIHESRIFFCKHVVYTFNINFFMNYPNLKLCNLKTMFQRFEDGGRGEQGGRG